MLKQKFSKSNYIQTWKKTKRKEKIELNCVIEQVKVKLLAQNADI